MIPKKNDRKLHHIWNLQKYIKLKSTKSAKQLTGYSAWLGLDHVDQTCKCDNQSAATTMIIINRSEQLNSPFLQSFSGGSDNQNHRTDPWHLDQRPEDSDSRQRPYTGDRLHSLQELNYISWLQQYVRLRSLVVDLVSSLWSIHLSIEILNSI